jgi:multidrug resistance efflux pump
MAEIRVERVRKRGLGWLWLLLLVVLLAVAWYLWANGYFGARSTTPAADSARTSLDVGHGVVRTRVPV